MFRHRQVAAEYEQRLAREPHEVFYVCSSIYPFVHFAAATTFFAASVSPFAVVMF